ncbi:cytochrome oxidase biogenesis protein Surf1 facilitates heme A insertion [Enterovibrio norvegicus FF-33]|uniref:SURF1-like protein n=1 Tax=Enterovibrio norvegicus FF-454 TaxID=1185651 RepID=A0A1E5CGS0_9GAMM|nr:cytochrome oxidase biogenesis protein Surf1 facilitates heme A insertion [Enterovibrio norvegicus FF-454]OEE68744.1 cytochrome oxidase biogenesis protein Surf1 facilitates heme A insertion [Enterovibrio norvegicus FF-33]OEE82540.1 cytochrome oxidase biogenesis protein Surf1 facilitates heme A insertion [Enterovibrio norvegicus FF-162]
MPPSGQKGDQQGEWVSTSNVRRMRRWGFLAFTLTMVVLLVKLGMWQMSRAAEKETLLSQLSERQQQRVTQVSSIPSDAKGFAVALNGTFDVNRSVLLDNQTHQGQVGYRWMMPFYTDNNWLLVELGWIPAPPRREDLPELPEVTGQHQVKGIVDLPSKRMVLGNETAAVSWPLRVQSVDMAMIAEASGYTVLPWVIRSESIMDEAGETMNWNTLPVWEPVVMKPEKHYGYAMQWFGLAFVVAIGFVVWWRKGRL